MEVRETSVIEKSRELMDGTRFTRVKMETIGRNYLGHQLGTRSRVIG